MAPKKITTVRLDSEDLQALSRARKAGVSSSQLIRRGLRLVAARYYRGKRPPTTGLFVSTDAKLGEDDEAFKDLKK